MANETLNAQELLNACVLKYSLVKMDWVNCYNLPSGLGFYGFTVKIDDKDNFLIVNDFVYNSGDSNISCIGWDRYTTLEDAYKHLDYLLTKLSLFERKYKRYLESKRLKKIKNDF